MRRSLFLGQALRRGHLRGAGCRRHRRGGQGYPAGICSRWINGKVRDMKWHNRFIKDAMYSRRQIIPIYIAGTLSTRFYMIYRLRRLLGINTNIELILLADELFRQKGQTIDVFLGRPIDISHVEGSIATKCEFVRQKVYEFAK